MTGDYVEPETRHANRTTYTNTTSKQYLTYSVKPNLFKLLIVIIIASIYTKFMS